jgi:DNA-binding GntR family transcriptional regulator
MTASIQKIDAQTPVFRGKLALRMLTDIFRGKYADGDRLVEQDLAATYGVSRTPIREALGELAAVGLIELRANRGAVVLPFGRRELANIYQLREILEAAATKLACGKIPAMKLENLHARLTLLQRRTDEQWSDRAMALDRRLHDLIAEHTGNARLAREIANYRGFLQAVRLTVGNQQHAQRHGIKHHLTIIEALLANDPAAAHDAMVDHIRFTAALAADTLFPPSNA